MPIYEYQCTACERQFEVMQRITAEAGAECPGCGCEDCNRLMSATTFKLKGSGWYMTDYGKGGSSSPAPSTSESAGESSEGESASTTETSSSSGEDSASSSGGDDD